MERSLELGIDTPLYLRNICEEMYRVLGRLDEALDTARQAVVLAPSDPLCLQNIAIIHFHRLEIDEEGGRLRRRGLADRPDAARSAFRPR